MQESEDEGKAAYAGSYRNTSTRWGQLVAGDHIDGNRGILVIKDAFSNFKSAYPMPDESADSTMDAIKHFKGERSIERLYSDRSGEIRRALCDLHIVPDNSQLGVPQNNAVADRLVQDVLEGIRTALVCAGLPPCFWEYACQQYCMMENALPSHRLVAAGGERASAWDTTHGEPFLW